MFQDIHFSLKKKLGAKIINRPENLADDFSSSGEAVNDAITQLQNQGKIFEYVCTIYATAPLLQEKYLKEGFERLKNSNVQIAISVCCSDSNNQSL